MEILKGFCKKNPKISKIAYIDPTNYPNQLQHRKSTALWQICSFFIWQIIHQNVKKCTQGYQNPKIIFAEIAHFWTIFSKILPKMFWNFLVFLALCNFYQEEKYPKYSFRNCDDNCESQNSSVKNDHHFLRFFLHPLIWVVQFPCISISVPVSS